MKPRANGPHAEVHLCVARERHWLELWWSDSEGSSAPRSISAKSSHYFTSISDFSSPSASSSSNIWVASWGILVVLTAKTGSRLRYLLWCWWPEPRTLGILNYGHRQETQANPPTPKIGWYLFFQFERLNSAIDWIAIRIIYTGY